MRFVIRCASGPFPYPDLGPRGRELETYIPPGVEWKPINYGQGEGQVEIAGCEWGFYQTDSKCLEVALHIGQCPASVAFDLVQRIAQMTCGDQGFEISLHGTETR